MPRRQSLRFRPHLECLEDRVTPSVTVTTTLDPTTRAAGQLSLREAINMVNAGQVADNTIILPAGTYQNAQGALSITHSLTLQGAGDTSTVLDGGDKDRVVLIDPAAAVNVQIYGVTIRNGKTSGEGGGIDLLDTGGSSLTLTNCIVSGNQAANAGGGLALPGGGNGRLLITGSTIANNSLTTSVSGGGGIFLDTTGVVAISDTILKANVSLQNGGGIDILNDAPSSLTLSQDTFYSNQAKGGNGGVVNSTVKGAIAIADCLFLNNQAPVQGGALSQMGGTLTVAGSQFSGNKTGIGAAGVGGAVFFTGTAFSITGSTFNGNSASSPNGGGQGGAVNASPASSFPNGTPSSLTNDTFTRNSAALQGGGIVVAGSGPVAFLNDTFTGNSSAGQGGGVDYGGINDTVSFQNTLVAQNTAVVGADVLVFPFNGAKLVDLGGNFIGNLSGSSGFGPGTLTGNPQLGPLADNGSPLTGATGEQQVVQTAALLPGSPAIGAGMANGEPLTDERGFFRLAPDIGAFQFQNATFSITVAPSTPKVSVNGTETFTITVNNTSPANLPADNANLTLTLSAGLKTTGPLNLPLAAITAGQSQTFTVTATADALGTQMFTASVASVDANPNTISANATVTIVMPPPPPPPPLLPPTTTMPTANNPTTTNTPVGPLNLFAFGLGPTGIDLFEVDSIGDTFAVPLSGGSPIFLSAALQLPLAVIQDSRLLALLAGNNGQEYLIDIINPFNPLIEPALLAALMHG